MLGRIVTGGFLAPAARKEKYNDDYVTKTNCVTRAKEKRIRARPQTRLDNGGWHKGFREMNDYINDNFDTGFLSPRINFALFCASFFLAAFGLVMGVLA